MEYEVTEKDILNLLDSICYRLDKGSARLCTNCEDVWSKVKALSFILDQLKDKEDYEEEICKLQNQLRHCRQEKESIMEKLFDCDKEMQKLKEESDYNRKQHEEIEKAAYSLERKILEQARTIRNLQKALESYTTRGAKQGNQNAYKGNIDSQQVFLDIESGMSITKAAKKYNVCRETIRKRYKEGANMFKGC